MVALGGLATVITAFSFDKYELSPEFKSASTQATKELGYLMGWTSWDQTVVRNPKAFEKLNLGMQERFNELFKKGSQDRRMSYEQNGVKRPTGVLELVGKGTAKQALFVFEIERTLKRSGVYADVEAGHTLEGLRRVVSLGRRLSDTVNLVDLKRPSKKELKKGIEAFEAFIGETEKNFKNADASELSPEAKERIQLQYERTRTDLKALRAHYGL